MVWTVYLHIHTASGRGYVGLTKKRVLQRWNEHVNNAKSKRGKGCRHFWNAIRAYGKDAFSHVVLATSDSVEHGNWLEDRWVELLGTRDPLLGFNLVKGGSHVPHPVCNPWDRPGFREKLTASAVASLSDPVVAANRAAGAVKQRLTRSDPDFKVGASVRCKEAALRPEELKRRSDVAKALWADEEYRRRASGRWDDPQYRGKCSSGPLAMAAALRARTHCPKGHPYTSENTTVKTNGHRSCRACHNASGRARIAPSGPAPARCVKGHDLTPDRVFLNQGQWRCKLCNRARASAYHAGRAVTA